MFLVTNGIFICFLLVGQIYSQHQPSSTAFDNRISRLRGNVLRNITHTQSYQNNIVTSPLDASDGIRQVYRSLRDVYNKYIQHNFVCEHNYNKYKYSILGGTGLRATGSFLQTKVPDHVSFPCDVKHQRSRSVPTSVHQLRPGKFIIQYQ